MSLVELLVLLRINFRCGFLVLLVCISLDFTVPATGDGLAIFSLPFIVPAMPPLVSTELEPDMPALSGAAAVVAMPTAGAGVTALF